MYTLHTSPPINRELVIVTVNSNQVLHASWHYSCTYITTTEAGTIIEGVNPLTLEATANWSNNLHEPPTDGNF